MGINYNPKIVTDGLVLCYDAANDRSYPNTGTTWTDLAGSNDGTLTSGPTFDTTNGGSIVFDGTNDRVAIPIASLPAPNNSANFTYEAVVKFDSLGWRTVFSQDNGSGTGRILLGVHGTSSKLVTFITGSAKQTDFSALSTDTIYHVALKMFQAPLEIEATISIGLNGVWDVVSGDAFSYTGTGDINIGTEPGVGGGFLDGNILAVRIYNRALSDIELFQNYRTIKGRYS